MALRIVLTTVPRMVLRMVLKMVLRARLSSPASGSQWSTGGAEDGAEDSAKDGAKLSCKWYPMALRMASRKGRVFAAQQSLQPQAFQKLDQDCGQRAQERRFRTRQDLGTKPYKLL